MFFFGGAHNSTHRFFFCFFGGVFLHLFTKCENLAFSHFHFSVNFSHINVST